MHLKTLSLPMVSLLVGSIFTIVKGEPVPSLVKTIPLVRMQQVYDEVKTPFKYGVVIRGEENQMVDCPSIFRKDGQWYMVYGKIKPSEPWDKQYAHKPWVIKHDGVVYHYYCAVGDQGRVIALATSRKFPRLP